MQEYIKLADDELVKLFARGDNKAFDTLLKRHQTRVFSYIYSIVKNRDVADDLFQETFVKAITTIKQQRYSESGKFSAWISRIAHNLIIDYYRQEKSENLVSADDGEVDVLNRKDLADINIEDVLVSEQIHADVRRIIEALPENQREVLLMRYYRVRYAILNMRRIADENNIVLTL